MNILKPILIISLILSVCLNLYLAVKLIDVGVSLDHRSVALKNEVNSSNEEFELLSQLLVNDVTRQEILTISDNLSSKGLIVKNRDNLIQIGRLEITFNGDLVDSVRKF